MIQKTTLSVYRLILFFSILIFTKTNSYAQATIVPQQLGYPRICAGLIIDGKPFNEYSATFSYVDFPAGTAFEIELSDEAGNFTTPIATTKLSFTENAALQQQTIRFAVPTNLKGSDLYSLRVKSVTATPVYSVKFRNSQNVTSFPVYYRTFVESFYINNRTETAMMCNGGSISLSIDNPTPSDQPSSPANYTNLKYKWFKDDVAIAGQSGTTLVANAPGVYYAQIDYGGCNDENFSSNRVTVTTSSSGSSVTINSSLGNPFCASGSGTVLTATAGNSYVWKKDGATIAGATNRTYSTNESGVYSVEVDFGGCKATGSINLQSNSFDASIDAPDNYTLSEGETLDVTVTTSATGATFEWYRNGNLITGETGNSFTVSVLGNYTVRISQSSGCVATREFSFKINGNSGPASVIPNAIKLSGSMPFWNIPDEYKNASTKVLIISSNGEIVLDVVNYQGDWPQSNIDFKNVNPVYYYVIQSDKGEKKGSITVLK
ncbi:gliding motility protein SprC [Flavobacterium foetidum]|uniref:gliding motility protein SprC n=1 Tax=Flavobacterium foetidum TaxID=2026681 RepID=UPI0010755721|nr:gliding motility protein SprC [Flavobacterium foetidum]KAF2506636.1 gliding motility protein SprC [Flavobacterium foetidum]